MIHKLIMFFVILVTGKTFAQGIGIGTNNPLGVLHVDGSKDNEAPPSSLQLLNDVIINTNGKMGIGQLPDSSDPSVLQVNGPITVKANSAEPPQTGVTYVLASTDGTQRAKWLQNVALSPTVIGVLGSNGTNPEMVPPDGITKDGYKQGFLTQGQGAWTGIWIKLPPGSWIIQSSILLYITNSSNGGSLTNSQSIWARLSWNSKRDSGEWDPNDVITGKYVSGIIPGNTQFGLAVGTTLISNKTNADKVYYLNMNWSTPYGVTNAVWNSVGSSQWSENTIVAYPVISK